MESQGIYAAVYVSDLDASSAFYARLIGRQPDDKPQDTLVQWRGWGSAGLQLFRDPSKAGRGVTTLVFPDLVTLRATLARAGVDVDEIKSGNFGKISHTRDPDGNTINLAEPPKS
jgi:catechol 2,3-dioxygenase-like lactoylglutathione lyase family enzyme